MNNVCSKLNIYQVKSFLSIVKPRSTCIRVLLNLLFLFPFLLLLLLLFLFLYSLLLFKSLHYQPLYLITLIFLRSFWTFLLLLWFFSLYFCMAKNIKCIESCLFLLQVHFWSIHSSWITFYCLFNLSWILNFLLIRNQFLNFLNHFSKLFRKLERVEFFEKDCFWWINLQITVSQKYLMNLFKSSYNQRVIEVFSVIRQSFLSENQLWVDEQFFLSMLRKELKVIWNKFMNEIAIFWDVPFTKKVFLGWKEIAKGWLRKGDFGEDKLE